MENDLRESCRSSRCRIFGSEITALRKVAWLDAGTQNIGLYSDSQPLGHNCKRWLFIRRWLGQQTELSVRTEGLQKMSTVLLVLQ
jgi:hypothetical protein